MEELTVAGVHMLFAAGVCTVGTAEFVNITTGFPVRFSCLMSDAASSSKCRPLTLTIYLNRTLKEFYLFIECRSGEYQVTI